MAEYLFSVRLTPRASQDKIVGWEGDVLKVRVTAPPVEGKANDALLRLLARALDVPTSRLRWSEDTRSGTRSSRSKG